MKSVFLFFLCTNLLLLCSLAVALPKGKRRMPVICLGLFLSGCSLALYAHLGHIWLPDHPLQERSVALQKERDVDAAARAARETFAALTPEERAERIRAMVASLSTKLYRNGGAPDAWLRLARAERTLGNNESARAALEQAEAEHGALKEQKAWLAASIAILLSSPLDENDKRHIRQQLLEAKALFGDSDVDLKSLENRLLPLLE